MKKKILGWLTNFLVVIGLVSTLLLGVLAVTSRQEMMHAIRTVILIKTQALQPVTTPNLITGAVKGMVASLEDPYSAFLEPAEYRNIEQHISGSYGGVGLLIGLDEEKRLIVVSPFKGTPAHRAGIQAGDIILRIDQQDTAGMDLEKAASLMQGKPGTKVNLSVGRKEEKEKREYTITREIIEIPTVEGKMLEDFPGVGYINLTTFNEHTGRDVGLLLDEMKQAGLKGVILDLRNNPGGYLGAAVQVADYFVASGPIVHIVGRFRSQQYKADGKALGLPLVVLINGGSASASEILAGAIKDSGAGVIVGEKTFGKGLVQTLFRMEAGAAVKLTTDKYLTPAKHDINKKGIEPDIVVPLEGEKASQILMNAPDPVKDPQLKRGIEILRTKIKP
ncbi:MAG: S41 family peptidase [Bacillota bacterium]